MKITVVFSLSLVLLVLSVSACGLAEISTPSPTSTWSVTSTNTATASPMPLPPTLIPTPSKLPAPLGPPQIKCVNRGLPDVACINVTANAQWDPFIREFNQIEMVLVPVGCFQMGNDDGFAEEQPAHEICFDEPFWIDLTEVTVSQFVNFLNGQPEPVDSYQGWLDKNENPLNENRYQLALEDSNWYSLKREENRPIKRVTWVGASDYCKWRGARLPTEAEWEYAARGPESYLYPWGNELDMGKIFIMREIIPEVGSIPEGASWVGALDMAGSLFEWTSSLYKPYPYQADDGREVSFAVDGTGFRVFRGSPWYHSDQEYDNISATARFEGFTDYGYWYHGFRCARSID
jgi:formylglycine-generating enzyme required for sulfatase activity